MDDQIKTIKEISVGIYDMALTKSTDILLSMAVQMLNTVRMFSVDTRLVYHYSRVIYESSP
jgi:hypothetical protein